MALLENTIKGGIRLSDGWLKVLHNSSLDPCPDAAEEIESLRARNDQLTNAVKSLLRGWTDADLTEAEFLDASALISEDVVSREGVGS